ncbi:Tm-1-like ATP-binding domain-containing protein [Pareuzebyella sediminis]|uniref:Tm-1-like ATP-binding domain-containing protein n=1 Tax=Pareuzebyella sediminis TaxID=2607998 RepID=UPI0011ED3F97|nr:Tm-1-like ATP-binding domain-containing protein [Pareuzebyella sediminis]
MKNPSKKPKRRTTIAPRVVMIGCFDTKAEDFEYLYQSLLSNGVEVIAVNTGVLGTTQLFPVTFEAEQVAMAGGQKLSVLREKKDRGHALEVMGKGASKIVADLEQNDKVDGIIGMGGGGGTFVAIKAMCALSFGIPKLCLSTLATKDLSGKIGDKDITLVPTIVDVAGLNHMSRVLMSQSAGAICGMISAKIRGNTDVKGSVAISVFGNTSISADRCSKLLKSEGYDVLSFHAVGTGGMTMESLISDGVFDAVLDLTTTELADDLCGGICSAGPSRLTAAGASGLPQVVVPGCLDMVNFGSLDSVPEKYRRRKLFSWAPDVTLMRTNKEENRILGKRMAEKLNAAKGPVCLVFPLGGLSKIGGEGEIFHDPETDRVLFEAIRKNVVRAIKIIEVEANINTPYFGDKVSKELLTLIEQRKTTQ